VAHWLRQERTRRWLDPLAVALAIACLGVAALLIRTDNAFVPILLVPVGGVLVTAFVRSLARRPRLSLAAEYTGSSTTSRQDGARVVSNARVVLFLRNGERAGEAKHVKVELTTIAAPGFDLDPLAADATHNIVDGDTCRIVWQPGTLGPGAERELPLRSDEFAFDDDSASARVCVTAERMDPLEARFDVRVGRYDAGSGAAEFEATVGNSAPTP
jgi:hypothetical protein